MDEVRIRLECLKLVCRRDGMDGPLEEASREAVEAADRLVNFVLSGRAPTNVVPFSGKEPA